MRRIFKIEFLGSVASVVAFGFFIYYQFYYNDDVIIEIKAINIEELTKIPTDNNLEVKYSLNGQEVTNLFKIRFSIKNIGNKTIIGLNNIGLLTEPLPLRIKSNTQVYGIQITDKNFPIDLVNIDTTNYGLIFKQWKSGEFLELNAYIGNDDYSEVTSFYIDERDIIDGKVVLTEFKNEELTFEPRLIDTLPISLKNTAWWTLIICYVIAYITSFLQFIGQINSDEIGSSKGAKITFIAIWLVLNILFLTPLLWIIKV